MLKKSLLCVFLVFSFLVACEPEFEFGDFGDGEYNVTEKDIPELLAWLEAPHPNNRRIALDGAWQLAGPEASPLLPRLVEMVRDEHEDTGIRVSAAGLITEMEEKSRPAIPALINVMRNTTDERLRAAIAYTLFDSAEFTSNCVFDLIDFLESEKVPELLKSLEKPENKEYRSYAYGLSTLDFIMQTICKQPSNRKTVIEKVFQFAYSSIPEVRCSAIKAIAILDPNPLERSIPLIKNALADEHPAVRRAAQQSLEKLNSIQAQVSEVSVTVSK